MNAIKFGKCLLVMVVSGLSIGCQAPQRVADSRAGIQEIPQLSSAYLAAVKHRQSPYASTRLPIRQKQERNDRELMRQCSTLIADVQGWQSSATLTADGQANREQVQKDLGTLRTSLEELRAAAGARNASSMRSAHGTAVAAYGRIQGNMEISDQ